MQCMHSHDVLRRSNVDAGLLPRLGSPMQIGPQTPRTMFTVIDAVSSHQQLQRRLLQEKTGVLARLTRCGVEEKGGGRMCDEPQANQLRQMPAALFVTRPLPDPHATEAADVQPHRHCAEK